MKWLSIKIRLGLVCVISSCSAKKTGLRNDLGRISAADEDGEHGVVSEVSNIHRDAVLEWRELSSSPGARESTRTLKATTPNNVFAENSGITASDSDVSHNVFLRESDPGEFFAIGPSPTPANCASIVDFESGTSEGWVNDPTSTCSTGAFVIGTPSEMRWQSSSTGDTVTTQVGGDHSTGGVGNALYTAVNTNTAPYHDVDRGYCRTTSPLYFVGVESCLSVWYFHGQRDTGDDTDDGFLLEISKDGGGTWSDLVRIGDVRSQAVWREAVDTIPAGSVVQLRLTISDSAAAGDLIEGGLDDLYICPSGTSTCLPRLFHIDYTDFSSVVGWTLNGDAAQVDAAIQLTADASGKAGSAFYSQPISLVDDVSFESFFCFKILGGTDGADGMAFVIQNDPKNGPNAVGSSGSSLGFDGIERGVGAEFDTLAYFANELLKEDHVGFFSGTVDTRLVEVSAGMILNDGSQKCAWVDYNGVSDVLSLYLSDTTTKPQTPLVTTLIDLESVVGNEAYFGFSAGTGGNTNAHRVLSWQLDQTDSPTTCYSTVDFENGSEGWENDPGSTCSTGAFIVGIPAEMRWQSSPTGDTVTTQVGGDHSTGLGNALYTAENTSRGTNDVDGGSCRTISPIYTVDVESCLSVWYFHGQRDTGDDSADGFLLEISKEGGQPGTWSDLVRIGDVRSHAVWREAVDSIPAGSEVQLRLTVTDGAGPGDLSEGGIDDLYICPSETSTCTPTPFHIDYIDFSSVTGWTLNADAEHVDAAIQLTADASSEVGSAFYSQPISLDDDVSFESFFCFEILGGADGANGMAFVIQNDRNGPNAVGSSGSSLGFDGIERGVGAEFDTYPYFANGLVTEDHVGFFSGTVDTRLVEVSAGMILNDGSQKCAWVEYNGVSDVLSLYLSDTTTKPQTPLAVTLIDLESVVGSEAYFGFSAGTGSTTNAHRVLSWRLDQTDSQTTCSVNVDFENGSEGWKNDPGSTCSTGAFTVGNPSFMQHTSSSVVTQVGGDHSTGVGNALYTAENTSPGNADVDGGFCRTISPMYFVDVESCLSVWYFHGQRDTGDDSADGFVLEISKDGGKSWRDLVRIGDVRIQAAWREAVDTIPAGSVVQLRLTVSDGSTAGDLIEGGIDDLRICPSSPSVGCPVPPDCIVNCTFTPTQCESSPPCECDISPSDLCVDDSVTIQNALNTLDNLSGNESNTLRLNGDFVFCTTIYIPPNINWILIGSMTLCDNADLDEIGYVNVSEGIDATRLTAITETVDGASNISMRGGYYDGNKANQVVTNIRLINFVAVADSTFRDMTIDNALDDGFTLGPLSTNNECYGLIGKHAGGNGLTDKGSYNAWYDCIAEDCASDGWTIKCRHSSFHACIGRNNEGPGFGAYARIDGSDDKGETINWNSFYAIEAYGNRRGGFSANIASNAGSGAMFCDNYIQGSFYNNAMDGLTFRNKQSDGLIRNNQVDVVVYNNTGLLNNGDPGIERAGLAMDLSTGFTVDNTTGIVVAHGNGANATTGYDVNVNKATTTSLTIYADSAQSPPKLKCQDGSNNCPSELSVVNFACPSSPSSSYSQMKYCGLTTP